MPKTAISLFTGCGGSDQGAIECGFEILMSNDILPYAKAVYQANMPETDYILGDVREINKFPSADLLLGCYPCQGFSQGGVRDPKRGINFLYQEFARALGIIKPKAFVVENVSGMTRQNYRHLLDAQIKLFAETGYKVTHQLLNAADYGIAQDRRRVFIVGLRNDLGLEYNFPFPTHGTLMNPKRTIKDAIGGMAEWPSGEFYDLAFHWYYLSRDRRRDWHQQSKTILANARHTPLHPISPKLKKIGADAWVFETKEPARRLSYREAACLQGFPRDYNFPDAPSGGLMMRYKVVGNAVPPGLFKAVIQALPKIF